MKKHSPKTGTQKNLTTPTLAQPARRPSNGGRQSRLLIHKCLNIKMLGGFKKARMLPFPRPFRRRLGLLEFKTQQAMKGAIRARHLDPQ
jgi:hypothetical protein